MPSSKNKKGQGLAATEVTIKELLESGAHFGHQKRRWNPKMKRFIFEERNGIYIIDLAKTMQQIRIAVEAVKQIIGKRKSILFVDTRLINGVGLDFEEGDLEWFLNVRVDLAAPNLE